jgi:hypothetical protein
MKLLFSLTNLRKIALVSVFAFSTTCWGQVLAIPSYVQPGDPVWEQWQNAKRIGIMIVNLNNGDDTTFTPMYSRLFKKLRREEFRFSLIHTRVTERAIQRS